MKPFSNFFAALFLLCLSSLSLWAQTENYDDVAYTLLQDEPEKIHKLFIGFQPFYGELWATNPTTGFALEASYYHSKKSDYKFSLRRAYSSRTDMMKSNALANSSMDNDYKTYFNIEMGGTYHIKDEVTSSSTTMVLYKKNQTRNQWSSQVAPTTVLPSLVRTVIGGRIGTMIYSSAVDVNRIIERQGIDYADIVSSEGLPIPLEYTNDIGDIEQVNVFTNLNVFGMYLGGSITWIRNISVELEGFEPNIDDLIFTTYFDLLFGLSVKNDNVYYEFVEYDLSPLKSLPLGARIGFEGKRNRTVGMGFASEIGYRPGLKKGGFFGLVKITVPMFSTNADGNKSNGYAN